MASEEPSGGQVERASASVSVDLGFDSESSLINDLRIDFHSLPARHSVIKGYSEASRQFRLC